MWQNYGNVNSDCECRCHDHEYRNVSVLHYKEDEEGLLTTQNHCVPHDHHYVNSHHNSDRLYVSVP